MKFDPNPHQLKCKVTTNVTPSHANIRYIHWMDKQKLMRANQGDLNFIVVVLYKRIKVD